MVDAAICTPLPGLIGLSDVSEQSGQRGAAGPGACFDIALSIANIESFAGGDIEHLAGVQDGPWMGFAVFRGITADDTGRAPGKTELLHQWIGKPGGFVGDYAPEDAVLLHLFQQVLHARKQAGVAAQGLLVAIEQFRAIAFECRMPGFDLEAEAERLRVLGDELGERREREIARDARRSAAILRAGPDGVARLLAS